MKAVVGRQSSVVRKGNTPGFSLLPPVQSTSSAIEIEIKESFPEGSRLKADDSFTEFSLTTDD